MAALPLLASGSLTNTEADEAAVDDARYAQPHHSMVIDDTPPSAPARRNTATEALASGFVPGVGQLLQGRRLAAAIQFTTVVAYVVIGSELGLRQAMFFALAWNCYSVIDAYRYRAD